MNECLKHISALPQSGKVYSLLIPLIFCFWATSYSQYIIRSTQRTSPVITFEAGARFTYDDNIFLYSRKDLNDFRKSINSYRFPFETSDDFITSITGVLGIRPKLFAQKMTMLTVRYRQYIYAVNHIKSYQIFSLSLGQNLSKSFGFEIGYLYLPKYLIRFYKDPTIQTSPPTYIGCDFAEQLVSFETNYKLKKLLSLTPFYKYEIDNYAAKFNYYDTKAHRLGLNGSYRLRGVFELKGGFEYKIAKAKGPVPDISYNQLGWEVGAGLGRRKVTEGFNLRSLKIEIDYSQVRREFVTNNPPAVDPFHTGRVDKIQNFKVGIELLFSRIASISVGYELENRNVSSPYKEQIDEVKDYNNNKIGLGLNLRRF